MGPIPRSRERIVVKIKFECRPVLMYKHHDSLLFMVLFREALDRLCVRLNMCLVIIIIVVVAVVVVVVVFVVIADISVSPIFSFFS